MSKKPAKRNITNTATITKVELLGKAILFFGSKGLSYTCPTCKRTLQKGMLYEHGNERYCSRRCIEA